VCSCAVRMPAHVRASMLRFEKCSRTARWSREIQTVRMRRAFMRELGPAANQSRRSSSMWRSECARRAFMRATTLSSNMDSIEQPANHPGARAFAARASAPHEWVTQAQRQALATLQDETLEVLRRSLDGARDCALIDFPDHLNVGDSMIWLGELEALSRLGV